MDHIVHWLLTYKYLMLFPLAIIEGPILAIIAGFLCAQGYLSSGFALPVIVAGDLIGDSVCFLLGKKGVSPQFKKIIYRLGFDRRRVAPVLQFIKTHPRSFIPLSKITLGIGPLGIYLTGSSGIVYRKFIAICLVTSVCQYIIYLEMGILFGQAYSKINHYLDYTASIIIIVSLICFLIFIIQTLIRRL